MADHIEHTAHSSRLRRIQKLRRRNDNIGPLMFRWSVGLAIASVIFIVLVPAHRAWGIRAFGLFFASGASSFLVHSALETAEAWLKRDYWTTVWMVLWTALQAFIVFIGLVMLIVGLQRHA